MSDRFKFRVWNKSRQCFMTEKELFICGNGELVLIDEALSRTWVKDNPNYKVSFSTGLKDKNGKLIYEGDIIQIPDDYDTYGMFACEKREIYFNEGGFRLKPKWDKNSRGNWLEDTKDFEVIGNIYENKELLNEI